MLSGQSIYTGVSGRSIVISYRRMCGHFITGIFIVVYTKGYHGAEFWFMSYQTLLTFLKTAHKTTK
jgi:hypothetical protein